MQSPLAMTRRGTCHILPIAVVAAILVALVGSLVPVAADDADFGPQLTVDHNVAERGTTVTVSLNNFPANQHLLVFVRPVAVLDTGPDAVTVPVSLDAGGGGTVGVPTAGLAVGTYVIGVTGDAGSAPAVYRAAAFGVIDPGILGPRAVRFYPLPSDDRDG